MEVEGARSSIWRAAIEAALEAALGKGIAKPAIVLYARAADALSPVDTAILDPQIEAAKESEIGQDYLGKIVLPHTQDMGELDTAHQAATAQNEADWPHDASQRATNQHFIDIAYGRRKRDAIQAKADLDLVVTDWLDRPGQIERPPLAIWVQLHPDDQQAIDRVLAANAGAATAKETSNSVDGGQWVPTNAEPLSTPSGQDVLSDAFPEPMEDGQQYAQAGSSRPPQRRGGLPPETQNEQIRAAYFRSQLDAIRKLEPNNPQLSRVEPSDWIPTREAIARVHEELIRARQRAAGAIDTQESGIGIGPYARESIPARSGKRNFNEWERAEINRLGYRDGCHTCGIKNPATPSGNFILDHQRPTRLNTPEEDQRLLPQCLSSSRQQGLGIAQRIKGKADE
jgi:hypothetical protein